MHEHCLSMQRSQGQVSRIVHGIEVCALNIFIIDHVFVMLGICGKLKAMSSTLQGASKNLETFEVQCF